MIPKIIHQIHMGEKPFSEKELNWQKSWLENNPDWEYVFWDDGKIQEHFHLFENQEQFNRCNNFSEKSDVLRFEILYIYGGLYIDTDFQCLKPINPLFEGKDIVLFTQQPRKICGAFFGASKNNHLVKKLIDNLPLREKSHGDRISDCKYGPEYITSLLYKEGVHTVDGSASKEKTVFPYLWYEDRRRENFRKTHPEAYAVHHWSGSWVTH